MQGFNILIQFRPQIQQTLRFLFEFFGKYKSLITFTFRDSTANAKSVLSVLGACVKCGDEIELICDGPDEEEALTALTEAIEGGLGE